MLNRSGDWGLRRTVFWAAGRCEEAAQKVVLEQTPARLFYINDIIASLQNPKNNNNAL